jgi:toxin ParE1/3/4
MEYIISKALEDLNIWFIRQKIYSEQANRYYNLIVDEIEYVSENFLGQKIENVRKIINFKS